MPKNTRNHIDDLRAASRLAVDATEKVTDVVEAMHTTIASGPGVLGAPLSKPMKLINGLVYGSIRGVTRLVGRGIERALEPLTPWLGESAPGPERDAVQAALNGVLGDYLAETGNPFAIQMRFRHEGQALTLEREALRTSFAQATGRVVVLVHGSSMSDLQWLRLGHDHGRELAALGFTPVYLHYNSGLHVSQNGTEFAALLEQLVAAWPVKLESLTLLAHSMGGLVSRSACHAGEGMAWRGVLKHLVTLGTPHHGAPLERGGNWVELLLGVSRYSAPLARLARLRSAGVTDLRFGNLVSADWEGKDRFALEHDARVVVPLPAGVACFAVAGSTSAEGSKRPLGDGLVPVESALGRHRDAARVLAFAGESVFFGCNHLDLLSRREVFGQIAKWLA